MEIKKKIRYKKVLGGNALSVDPGPPSRPGHGFRIVPGLHVSAVDVPAVKARRAVRHVTEEEPLREPGRRKKFEFTLMSHLNQDSVSTIVSPKLSVIRCIIAQFCFPDVIYETPTHTPLRDENLSFFAGKNDVIAPIPVLLLTGTRS